MLINSETKVYQFRAWLLGVSPTIWRRFHVLSDSSIAELHETIQVLMQWEDFHLHRFIIRGKEYGLGRIGGISFRDNARKVKLSDFKFRINERFIYEYDFGDNWQIEIRLEKLLTPKAKTTYPICIEGACAAPEEDCGGVSGHMEFRRSYSHWRIADRLEELVEEGEFEQLLEEIDIFKRWLELDKFDKQEINQQLKLLKSSEEL